MIGIIGAMDIEVLSLLSSMDNKTEETVSGIVFTQGELYGKKCVVAKCGIGKVNAAVCTQTMILRYNPSCIINTGVGGATSLKTSIGAVVVASGVVQHDMDTTALGDEPATLFLHNGSYTLLECDKALAEKICSACSNTGVSPVRGIAATGDRFISGREERQSLERRFNAVVCEMEGGSIGQVCFINGVPFALLRSISDSMSDTDDAVEYNTFCKTAAENSVNVIKEFLKQD